jgi:hypothetical protein
MNDRKASYLTELLEMIMNENYIYIYIYKYLFCVEE